MQTSGSRRSDVLHCDVCGVRTYVLHEDVWDLYIRYLKRPKPYLSLKRDEVSPGEYLWPAEYHAAVEDRLRPCPCGGRVLYGASPRCPGCRSTEEMWDVDESGPEIIHD